MASNTSSKSIAHDASSTRTMISEEVKSGQTFTKLGRYGLPHSTTVHITSDLEELRWKSKSIFKSAADAAIPLHEVDRISLGQNTAQFARMKARNDVKIAADRSLSIIFANGTRSVDLIAPTVEVFRTWASSLREAVREAKARHGAKTPEVVFLEHQWKLADKDNSGTLSKSEIIALLRRLNIEMTTKELTRVWAEVDKDKSDELDKAEFHMLVNKLQARPEIEAIWCRLCDGAGLPAVGASFMAPTPASPAAAVEQAETLAAYLDMQISANDVLTFMRTEQGQTDATYMDAVGLVSLAMLSVAREQYEIKPGVQPMLSYAGFRALIDGSGNSAFDSAKQVHVYQDMTQPLAHYYIASSHNTYLEGNQLDSNSSVNRYINDLAKGCRCVELDCWDGDDGEPVIFHGHTLTGKIKFRDVIAAVQRHAFTSSQYPVILSLEMHCSLTQQERIAEILVATLGNLLERPPATPLTVLPSPEALRGKILIKGKRCKPEAAAEAPDTDSDDDDDDDEEGEGKKGAKAAKASAAKPAKKKKTKIAQALSDLTYLGGGHFHSFQHSLEHDAASDMYSFSEIKTGKLIKKSPEAWVQYNCRQLSRIYPGGLRVDSSNYDPMPSWCMGSQIVALNYQTACPEMQLNDGKFRDNGRSGYILKPAYLRDATRPFNPRGGSVPGVRGMRIRVTVVSGQHLPKPEGDISGELCDPFVMLSLHGAPADSAAFLTRVVDNNGFNPVWDETFTFTVSLPELALVSLRVMDEEVGGVRRFMAQTVIPVTALRAGLRAVQLYDSAGGRHSEMAHARLLLRVHTELI